MGRKCKADGVVIDLTSADIAIHLQDRRTKEGTRTNYENKIKHFIEWCLINQPTAVEEGQLKILAETRNGGCYSQCLSTEMIPVERPEAIPEGEVDPISHSTVVGYRSAIVDRCRRAKLVIAEDINPDLKALLDGQKLMNELRQRGLMKVGEGKRHIRLGGYILLTNKFMKENIRDCRVAGNWSKVIYLELLGVVMKPNVPK